MLVPRYPGVLCAMGCVVADLRHDFSQTIERLLPEEGGTRPDYLDVAELHRTLRHPARGGRGRAGAATASRSQASTILHHADMAYEGQVHRLRVVVEPGWEAPRAAAGLRRSSTSASTAPRSATCPSWSSTPALDHRPPAAGRRRDRRHREPARRAAARSRRVRFGDVDRHARSTAREDLLPGDGAGGAARSSSRPTRRPWSSRAWRCASTPRTNLVVTVAMIDPITLSVVRSGLEQVCNEMDLHLIRSALSPIISETNDCAHGIYDGRTRARRSRRGELGLPVFLANMQFSVQSVIEKAERDGRLQARRRLDPQRRLPRAAPTSTTSTSSSRCSSATSCSRCWPRPGTGWTSAAPSPGGWNPDATEIHQEGLVIPPVRLYEDGKLQRAAGRLDHGQRAAAAARSAAT